MGRGRVLAEWFSRKDDQGCVINTWAVKNDDQHIMCKLCNRKFSVASAGFDAVRQHASGKNHLILCTEYQKQLLLKNVHSSEEEQASIADSVPAELQLQGKNDSGATRPVPSVPRIELYSERDRTTIAELRWVLKCVKADFSAASCEGIGDLFRSMFGDDAVGKFSLSRTKARYIVTEALGPYFRSKLIEDIGDSFYSIGFDETTNSANWKELQIRIVYWSESSGRIKDNHLQTYFIGSATAEVIAEKIFDAIGNAGLCMEKLLMLSRDGPNVNVSVENRINGEMIKIRKKGLVKIGSCNIHVVHNAFLQGLKILGTDVSDLVLKLYYFFHNFPVRREDFQKIQVELKIAEHNFVKHVESRWLTLGPATDRAIEQRKAIVHYFKKFAPKERKDLLKCNSYKQIVEFLNQLDIVAQLKFVSSIAKVFSRFTKAFQASDPKIHCLYEELERLATTLLGRICSKSSLEQLRFL